MDLTTFTNRVRSGVYPKEISARRAIPRLTKADHQAAKAIVSEYFRATLPPSPAIAAPCAKTIEGQIAELQAERAYRRLHKAKRICSEVLTLAQQMTEAEKAAPHLAPGLRAAWNQFVRACAGCYFDATESIPIAPTTPCVGAVPSVAPSIAASATVAPELGHSVPTTPNVDAATSCMQHARAERSVSGLDERVGPLMQGLDLRGRKLPPAKAPSNVL